jgi:N utilization substance protein A
VDKGLIFEALEAALASATRKRHGNDIEVRVAIDKTTGNYETFRRWQVVEDPDDGKGLEFPKRQLSISAALELGMDIEIGGYTEDPMESAAFDRIAAQTAKQVIVQRVREAERAKVLDTYKDRQGELVTGVVKRLERGDVILDLGGNVEALVSKDHTITAANTKNKDSFRIGDRLRGYLYEIRPDAKGPQLLVSRTMPEFLIALFKLEVPEVGEGIIEIMKAARDPGLRAKIAVRTQESRIDPVGACVGMRGSRVQAVSNELNGEKVDIILWDDNPAQFVINAMAPVNVVSIIFDEEAASMDVIVNECDVSQAIGINGQNVRLASQLTGWEINVMNEVEASEKSEAEARVLIDLFRAQLHVDEEVANALVDEGFTSLDEVAYLPVAELLEIEDFDEPLVEQLRRNAKDALLTKAIAKEETNGIAPELLALEGMDNRLAIEMAARGVITMESLAEQSVDELMEIEGMKEQRAAAMIMKAREPWFIADAQKK